jgi:hypothetical protein
VPKQPDCAAASRQQAENTKGGAGQPPETARIAPAREVLWDCHADAAHNRPSASDSVNMQRALRSAAHRGLVVVFFDFDLFGRLFEVVRRRGRLEAGPV